MHSAIGYGRVMMRQGEVSVSEPLQSLLPPARLLAWNRGRYAPSPGCRALDALHVASALALGAGDFCTYDRDQAKLARATGLHVQGV
jgi:hypothetical protein